MSRTLFVHEDQAFTSEETLLEMTGPAPDEAGQFIYSGEVPKYLFRVEGPRVDFISDDMHRAAAELTMWGAGHRLTAIEAFWS